MAFFKQRPDKRQKIILDYVTVSYREILGILLVVVFGGIAAYSLWLLYFRQTDPGVAAQVEIKAAERALSRASSVLPPDREDLDDALGRARDKLTAAREYLRRGEFERAVGSAQDCQEFATQVYNAIQGKALHVAVLTDVRGNVDYQRQNSQSWLPASNGLELYPNDKVRTLRNSGGRLRYPNSFIVTLEPNSVTVVPKPGTDTRTGLQEVEVLLQRGEVTLEAPEDTVGTVRTPEAAGTVQGPAAMRAGREEASEQSEFVADTEMRVTTPTDETIMQANEGARVDRGTITERFEWIRAPELTTPPDGKVFLLSDKQKKLIGLSWQPVPNAVGYRLQVSRLKIFTGNVEVEHRVTSTSVSVEAPSFGTWWWSVTSLSEDDRRSIPAAPRSFKVRPRAQASGEGPAIRLKPVVVVGTKALIEGSTDPGTLLTYSVNGSQEVRVNAGHEGEFTFFATMTRPGVNEILIRGQSPTGAITEELVPAEYRTD